MAAAFCAAGRCCCERDARGTPCAADAVLALSTRAAVFISPGSSLAGAAAPPPPLPATPLSLIRSRRGRGARDTPCSGAALAVCPAVAAVFLSSGSSLAESSGAAVAPPANAVVTLVRWGGLLVASSVEFFAGFAAGFFGRRATAGAVDGPVCLLRCCLGGPAAGACRPAVDSGTCARFCRAAFGAAALLGGGCGFASLLCCLRCSAPAMPGGACGRP